MIKKRLKYVFREDLTPMYLNIITSLTIMGILVPALPLYFNSLEFSKTQIGLIISCYFVAMAIFEPFWGWASQKIGMKKPLMLRMVFDLIFLPMFAFTNKIYLFIILQLSRGIMESSIWPIGRGYIGTNVSRSEKGFFMAIFNMLITVGFSTGALMSGFVIENFGFEYTFYLASFVSIFGIYASTKIKEIKKDPVEVTKRETVKKFSYKILIPFFLITPMQSLSWSTFSAFFPIFTTEIISLNASDVGIFLAINGFVSFILMLPAGKASDRYGRKKFITIGTFIFGITFGLLTVAQNFSHIVFIMILNSVGVALFRPTILSHISDITPPSEQAKIMGFYGTLEDIGVMIGPMIGGFVWDNFGPEKTFYVCMGALLLASLISFRVIVEIKGRKEDSKKFNL